MLGESRWLLVRSQRWRPGPVILPRNVADKLHLLPGRFSFFVNTSAFILPDLCCRPACQGILLPGTCCCALCYPSIQDGEVQPASVNGDRTPLGVVEVSTTVIGVDDSGEEIPYGITRSIVHDEAAARD